MSGATAAGNLPFPALGAGAVIAVGELPRWELSGQYFPAHDSSVSASNGVAGRVRVSLLSARPAVCLPVHGALGACVAMEVGRMTGQGIDVPNAGSGHSWWLAPSAGPAVHIPVAGPLSVRVRLDAGLALFRPTFTVERLAPASPDEVWRPDAAFAVISVEPELQLFPTDSVNAGHLR